MSRILLVGHDASESLIAALRRRGWAPLTASPVPMIGVGPYPGRFDGRRVVLPPVDRPEFISSLLEFAGTIGIAAVVPTDAGTSLAIAPVAAAFESRGIAVVGSGSEVVRRCDDRITLNRTLRPVVPTGRVEPWTPSEPLPFAAMIRPRFASLHGASIEAHPSGTASEVTEGSWCLEKIGPGAAFRVDLAVGPEGRILHFQSTTLGDTPRLTIQDVRIRAWAQDAVRHLRLRGVSTLFLRGDRDDRPLVMDVRPHAVPDSDARSAAAIHAALGAFLADPTAPMGASTAEATPTLSLAA